MLQGINTHLHIYKISLFYFPFLPSFGFVLLFAAFAVAPPHLPRSLDYKEVSINIGCL